MGLDHLTLHLVLERLPESLAFQLTFLQASGRFHVASVAASAELKLLEQFFILSIEMLDLHLKGIRVPLEAIVHGCPLTFLVVVALLQLGAHLAEFLAQIVVVLVRLMQVLLETSNLLSQRRLNRVFLSGNSVGLALNVVQLVLKLEVFPVELISINAQFSFNFLVHALFEKSHSFVLALALASKRYNFLLKSLNAVV